MCFCLQCRSDLSLTKDTEPDFHFSWQLIIGLDSANNFVRNPDNFAYNEELCLPKLHAFF